MLPRWRFGSDGGPFHLRSSCCARRLLRDLRAASPPTLAEQPLRALGAGVAARPPRHWGRARPAPTTGRASTPWRRGLALRAATRSPGPMPSATVGTSRFPRCPPCFCCRSSRSLGSAPWTPSSGRSLQDWRRRCSLSSCASCGSPGEAGARRETICSSRLSFAVGSVYYFVAAQGSVWFAAHVVAAAFICLYLLCSFGARRPAAAGLALGLAFLCRPATLLLAGFFVLQAITAAKEEPRPPHGPAPRLLRTLAMFALPLAAVVAVAMWHNAAALWRPVRVRAPFPSNPLAVSDRDLGPVQHALSAEEPDGVLCLAALAHPVEPFHSHHQARARALVHQPEPVVEPLAEEARRDHRRAVGGRFTHGALHVALPEHRLGAVWLPILPGLPAAPVRARRPQPAAVWRRVLELRRVCDRRQHVWCRDVRPLSRSSTTTTRRSGSSFSRIDRLRSAVALQAD